MPADKEPGEESAVCRRRPAIVEGVKGGSVANAGGWKGTPAF